jgi:aspartyl-tRNA(Asn)/glutamyl-tRNA(Gln) amidotransferase subunit B
VRGVLEANPKEVQAYLDGKETLSKWLFGQVMRAARGQANPQVLQGELDRQLRALRQG